MGFSINMRNVQSLRNYAEAQEYYNNTDKPRTLKWADYQRPLRDTRSRHLRLEKSVVHGLNCFELVLYSTPLIRYYQPDADGSQAIHIQNHYSQSSQAFLWNHGWYGGKRLSLDTGGHCRMTLSYESSLADRLWGDSFTTRIVLRPDGTVDTKRSVHVPYFRRKSSSTMRAKRARFREAMQIVFDLAELKFAEAVAKAQVRERDGRPFDAKQLAHSPHFREALTREFSQGEVSADTMGEVVHFCMEQLPLTVESIIAHRAWRYERPRDMTYSQAIREGRIVIDQAPLSEQGEPVRQALTPTLDAVNKVLLNDLMWLAGLGHPDERAPYPQFGEFAQRCYTSGGARNDAQLAELLGIGTYQQLVARKGVIY